METILIVIGVAAVAGAVFWWTRGRAHRPPAGAAEESPTPQAPRRHDPLPEPQVLDRNTVLGRSRAFDPTNWDNTPDGYEDDGPDNPDEGSPDGGPAGEDLPRFFDRDYLERKNRGDAPQA